MLFPTPLLRLVLTALGIHDQATLRHMLRVAAIVQAVAPRLGFSNASRTVVIQGALFHDIGKLLVPGEILRKYGRLNSEEWSVTAAHPQRGALLLERLGLGKAVADVVRHHHERWDGGGYPLGLSGALIPPAARLVAVADAFDVMTAGRPYARARSVPAALAELRAGAGSQWAPAAVEAVAAWAAHTHAPVKPLELDHVPLVTTGGRMSAAS
jgi:putative nucleotidyltransferase with HDIG domain